MEYLTVWQGLFNIGLWGLIVIVLLPATKYPYKLNKPRRVCGIALIFLFCLFPFWGGDYFHYMEGFNNVKMGGYAHFEGFYLWIINNIADYYFVFRLIVWGLALTLLLIAYKRIDSNFDQILFYFAALYLPWFSYARASLAMASIILGITFLIKPTNRLKILSYLGGIALIVGSIFFHRSAAVGMVAVLASYFIADTKRNKILLLILLYPFIVYFISKAMDYYMAMDMSFDEEYNIFASERKRDNYLSGTGGFAFRGLGASIGDVLNRGSVLLMPLFFILYAVRGYFQKLNRTEKFVGSYVICVALLATGFILVNEYSTQVLFYRTLFYAYPANAVFMASIRARTEMKGFINIIYWMGIAGSGYVLLYATYCAYKL